MITDSFDNRTAPLMTPGDFYGPQQQLCDLCIGTFSHVIFEQVVQRYGCEKIASIHAANGTRDVYALDVDGKKVALCLMGIGATLAGTDVIDLNWLTGATKFILFGSAGSLNRAATEGKYVIPTEAYRDEGMSYHYAPPADYIRVANAARVEAIFSAVGAPWVSGRIWTTDAFYRETRAQVEKRQREGCLAVEMEIAGVQAVCDFHGFELYTFLATGDVLDAPVYDPAGLNNANHDFDKFYLALEIARRV